jgi:hypothetical protein
MDKHFVTRMARNLQAGYTKDTLGVPRKWVDVQEDEKLLWLRMARRAIRLVASEKSKSD